MTDLDDDDEECWEQADELADRMLACCNGIPTGIVALAGAIVSAEICDAAELSTFEYGAMIEGERISNSINSNPCSGELN